MGISENFVNYIKLSSRECPIYGINLERYPRSLKNNNKIN
jgi:hypothetical protein